MVKCITRHDFQDLQESPTVFVQLTRDLTESIRRLQGGPDARI